MSSPGDPEARRMLSRLNASCGGVEGMGDERTTRDGSQSAGVRSKRRAGEARQSRGTDREDGVVERGTRNF